VGKDERDMNETMNGEATADEVVEDANVEMEEDAQDVIEKLIAQRDEYLDQLQRSRAEFINYRKRTEAERLKLGELFTSNTLSQFLPVIDDFDRALDAVPEDKSDHGWVSGITMIHTKLRGLLERAGVKEVDGVNAPFDPAIHEAVASEPGSSGDHVVEVYQKGYKLGDTLLRAAMVKTGDKTADPNETENVEA
jgi:molecular chaperone GrpE